MIAELSARELSAWRIDANRDKPLLIDVRERWEFDYCRIEDSLSMPMAALPRSLAKLPDDRDIVLVCHHGERSRHAALLLAQNGFARVHNLSGGVAAWASDVDPTMKRY